MDENARKKSSNKNKKHTFCGNVNSWLEEYDSSSTIHGVKYISEKDRSIFER